MRAAAIVAGAAVLTSALVGHAASLNVDAGVLQTLSLPVDIDLPDPEPEQVSVRVIARRFSSSKNAQLVGQREVTALIPLGGSYVVTWTGGDVVPCQTIGFTVPEQEVESTPGTFTAEADITRSFCAQTGSGELSIEPLQSTNAEAPGTHSDGTDEAGPADVAPADGEVGS